LTTTINASPTNGIVQTADGSGVMKLQSNGVTTNALAWANFGATTAPSVTIASSYNISSITRSSAGVYSANFTTAMSDANYAVVGSCNGGSTGLLYSVFGATAGTATNARTTTSATITTGYVSSTGGASALQDHQSIAFAIFGN
jgi:hypothetical protein